MIPASPTLRIEDRAGRVHRFILRRRVVGGVTHFWTHNVHMMAPTPAYQNGMAWWTGRDGQRFAHVPVAPDDPLRGLAVLLKVHGVRAEHLLGEEPLCG